MKKTPFKDGQIVRHKLTREKMIVLPSNGFGASSNPKVRVRNTQLEEKHLDECELEPIS